MIAAQQLLARLLDDVTQGVDVAVGLGRQVGAHHVQQGEHMSGHCLACAPPALLHSRGALSGL